MSSNTMSFALPESLRVYIDARVKQGNYGNTSEYLRELVRRDQIEQDNLQFRQLIADGLASGPGREYSAEVAAEIKSRIFERKL